MKSAKEIMTNDNSIIYLTMALICLWVILDNFFGKKILWNLIETLFNGSTAGQAYNESKTIEKETGKTPKQGSRDTYEDLKERTFDKVNATVQKNLTVPY